MIGNYPAAHGELPFISTAQMVRVDELMITDYGISLLQMMENAGRCLADLARHRFLDGDLRGRRVVVLAGRGGNGGGALAAARRLHNGGAQVRVLLARPAAEFSGVPAQQLAIVARLGITVASDDGGAYPERADLVIDGLIGYSLRGAPRGKAAACIRWANEQPAPVLALDIPSGVDGLDGVTEGPALWATATMTLALPKVGLRQARPYVGELYAADISVPPALYADGLGLETGPIFARSDIVRVW